MKYGTKRTSKPAANRFANMIGAELKERELWIKDVRDAGKITYEHARKLVRGEAVPSKAVSDNIAQLLGLNRDHLWAMAQEDKLERKYGTTLVAKAKHKDPRLAEFQDLILALRQDQVPAALAMLRGLVDQKD